MDEIEILLKDYPMFLDTDDLVKLNLYSDRDATYIARTKNQGPDFIKHHRKILYPKSSVIKYLKNNMKILNT